MQHREPKYHRLLPKYQRAPTATLPLKDLTERSLAIIAIIERYKLISGQLIEALAGGNARVTRRHLQTLYHIGLINRFAFPRSPVFNYYLDNKRALQLLCEQPGFDPETLDWNAIENNREKAYCDLLDPKKSEDMEGRKLFLKHELMISRFHAMLELACRHRGNVQLLDFRQGPELWNSIELEKLRLEDGQYYRTRDTEQLPHRPDAYFALRLASGEQRHFFYEADRKTTWANRFAKKLRAHFHYIVKARKHEQQYGFHRVRAVLIETLDTHWVDHLRDVAKHPLVSNGIPSPLFWFTSSQYFTEIPTDDTGQPRFTQAPYLYRPDLIFAPLWLSPVNDTPLSLLD